MGVDIHINICKDGKNIATEIYDDRNYEWFDNMTRQEDILYRSLNIRHGISPQSPEIENEEDFYNFRFIKVKDFIHWYRDKRPDVKAGWVTTKDRWLYINKNIMPSKENVFDFLTDDMILKDMVFLEYDNEYEPSSIIYHYLIINDIPEDADIVYYFDC